MSLSRNENWVYTSVVPDEHTTTRRVYYFEPGQEYGWRDDDGVLRYRLNCSYWFGDWIETQDRGLWRSYGGRHRAIYIVRDELMTLIRLQWV